MPDVRSPDDMVAVVTALEAKIADLESTLTVRMARRPTGDIEPTIRSTPKPDSLLLQGQTISRTDYPVLWQWVVDNGLSPSVFGAGDGSTTFVLPDLRGKAAVGATTVDPLGKSFGSPSVQLTSSHLPLHNHSIGTDGDHWHGIFNTNLGDHSGHNSGGHSVWVASNATGQTTSVPDNYYASWGGGPHNHGMNTEGDHNHGGATGNAGFSSPASIFVVQPSYAINWLIYT